jgi:hypothetical protein
MICRGGRPPGSPRRRPGLHTQGGGAPRCCYAPHPPLPPCLSDLPGRVRRGRVLAAAGQLHVPALPRARGRAAQRVPRVRADARCVAAPGAVVPPPLPHQALCGGRAGGAGRRRPGAAPAQPPRQPICPPASRSARLLRHAGVRAPRLRCGRSLRCAAQGPAAQGEEDRTNGGALACFGCFAELRAVCGGGASLAVLCPDCRRLFCYECDAFVHEHLHNCPGCECLPSVIHDR